MDTTEGLPARIGQALQAASVRTKILGMVLALTLALGLAVAIQVRMTTYGVLEREMGLRGAAVADDLAGHVVEPILLGDTFVVHELIHETIASHDDVVYAFVVDSSGAVVAHSFEDEGFPVGLLELPASDSPYVFDSELGRTHDFTAQALDGDAGTIHVGLSESRLRSLVHGVTAQMLLTTLAVALTGIGAAVLLTRVIVRPIAALVAATRRVGSGDLTARAPRAASDEIGLLTEAFNQMVEDLETSQGLLEEKEEARARLLDQIIAAQEEERKRIARELHDGVGQSLNSLALGLSTLTTSGTGTDQQLQELRTTTLESLEMVRELSRQLRPSVLDDLGLGEALERYSEEIAAHHPGVRVDTHIDLDERLPPSVETTVYRIVQEGLTNAARHSGGALLSLIVTRRNGSLSAIIEDDGSGFDVAEAIGAGRSVGLHAIRERAELIGGRAIFESSTSGTTVFIEVPV